MELLTNFLIITHVFSGGGALMAGLLAIIAPKGGKVHLQIGKIYFGSMLGLFFTALLMLIFVRFNLFLLVIAIFSFYMCFSGYRVLRRKKLGEQTNLDWGGAIITLIAGLVILCYGLLALFQVIQLHRALMYLCLLFGFFTAWTAWTDILIFKKKDTTDKMWWLYHHIQSMVGSYIAAITAFLVQNGQGLIPFPNLEWLIWVLPAMVGSPVISYWIGRYRKRFRQQQSALAS